MDVVKQYLNEIKNKSWEEIKNLPAWIMALQIALESQGIEIWKIDWLFWNRTRKWIRTFQEAYGWSRVTGVANPETIQNIIAGLESWFKYTKPVEEKSSSKHTSTRRTDDQDFVRERLEYKDTPEAQRKAREYREADEREQKELERVYNLKDEKRGMINGKSMTYRQIDNALKAKDDFVYDERSATRGRWATPKERYEHIQEAGRHPKASEQEKYIAASFRQMLEEKHRLENQYPDLKRKITKWGGPSGGVTYVETKNSWNPNYDL